MGDYVRMITATLDVRLEWSLPSAEDIENAFESAHTDAASYWDLVAQQADREQWIHVGDWAGTTRITRRNRGTGYTIVAAAPYVVPGYDAAEIVDHVLDDDGLEWQRRAVAMVIDKLNDYLTISNGWNIQDNAYQSSLNGPLSWWSTGQAARTRTRFAAPGALGLTDAVENPVGPDSAALRPNVPLDFSLGNTAKILVPVVIGGLVLWSFSRAS